MAQIRIKDKTAYIYQHIHLGNDYYVTVDLYTEHKPKRIKYNRPRQESSRWSNERWQKKMVNIINERKALDKKPLDIDG